VNHKQADFADGALRGWPWLGWSGERRPDAPQAQCWPGASPASLASDLASTSRRGMLRRGFAPPGQPRPTGPAATPC
jgi:hypothetical protein